MFSDILVTVAKRKYIYIYTCLTNKTIKFKVGSSKYLSEDVVLMYFCCRHERKNTSHMTVKIAEIQK